MAKNIDTKELEALVTLRVLSERMIARGMPALRTRYTYSEIQRQAVYALDDILVEHELNKELWARIRRNRAYLFYLPSNSIIAEVGIITDYAGPHLRKNFRLELFGYKGRSLPATIADLILNFNERKNHGSNHYQKNFRKTRNY